MSAALKGFAAGVGLVSLMGFIQSRPGNRAVEGPTPEGRFVIYGPDDAIPLLLDTRTGRTWYRQYGAKDQDGNSTGLFWTPVKMTPADTGRYYFLPLNSDIK